MSSQKATISPVQAEAQNLGLSHVKIRSHRIGLLWHSLGGSNKTLFLVHGGGGRAGQYRLQAKVLCERMSIVAFDFLGHGISEKIDAPELYSADEHFETLKTVYSKYKTEVNYIGAHCYGAIHVMRLLAHLKTEQRLDEVKKVVFFSAGADPPAVPSLALKMPNFLLEWLRPLARNSSNAQLFSPNAKEDLVKHENSISSANPMYMMKHIGQDILAGSWTSAVEEAMPIFKQKTESDQDQTAVPEVLLIHGKLDKTVPIESMKKLLATMFANATYRACEIDGAGHLVMLEAPVKVNAILASFLYH